ncbi:phage tail protein [Pseudomonas fitomaticsae]|uniref:Phage tail protein n=1 Tax=Pseudomonas fitomaticsae TaxID=2837969 RepID=A0ABY3PXA3_9PSED|nr:phage tail protein [Pseudomonas fitomaticsae]UFP98547.1 phage tail protein [Pseudomonas fitomaticsae]
MAEPEVFTWCPMVDAVGTETDRVRTAQFGDGYSQAVGDGINTRVGTYPVTFTGKREMIVAVKAFLDRHGGHKSFLWTPPLGEPSLFRAPERTISPKGADVFTLTTTFNQVFAP